jgi:alkylation response protein AidB-like acyl-CoA dehydrogenase
VIDFSLPASTVAFRAELDALLDEALTPEMVEECHTTGTFHNHQLTKALAARGMLALDWPVEHGGQGREIWDRIVFLEQMNRREAPYVGIGTTMIVAHTILALGTELQKAAILPRALAGELLIALGFTEPENGSDASAAKTRAVRTEDGGWSISGSKMFTTNAHIADYVFVLARTNPDVPKHRGLTTFLVPTDQPGFEARQVRTLSGERTNVTFYNDVRIGDEWRVGEVDGGWTVMSTALGREHTASFHAEHWRLAEAFTAWAAASGRSGDPDVREQIGRCRTDIEVSQLLLQRAVWAQHEGLPAHGLGSISKLFSSERLEQQSAAIPQVVGRDGLRSRGEATAVGDGTIEHMQRFAKGTTTYAGTSEVHRNVIAQHVLSLPRPS